MPKRKKISQSHDIGARSGGSISTTISLGVPAGIALIVVSVFLAYLPAINGGFILDDDKLLTNNRIIKTPDGLYRFWCTTEEQDYWPVTYSTLWVEWRMWGNNPTGYHVTNLILHIVESLLIWIILRKLSIPGAFFAAMLFALHPVNVESVAWISQRKNLMAMLFFLLSILCYLKFLTRAHRPTFGRCPVVNKQTLSTVHCPSPTFSSFILYPSSFCLWYWLSLAAFVLAMLSKGSVAVLPVLLLVIVWWLRLLTRWDILRTMPFFIVAAALTSVNLWFQTHGTDIVVRDVNFAERLQGAGGVVWFYLYKALLPLDLAFIYPQWHIKAGNLLWWLPLSAALVFTAVLWRYGKSWSRPFWFAWMFFCIALAPAMGFADVGFMRYSLVADHYQHIAIIGVITLGVAGWSVWRQQSQATIRSAANVVAVISLGILVFLTWRQCGIYCNAITLYQATLEKTPNCAIARHNLGSMLFRADRLQESIEQYEEALRLDPAYIDAHNNLGISLTKAGRTQEAIMHYEKAMQLKPDYPDTYNNLGSALARMGKTQEAIENFQHAMRLKSDSLETLNNLGKVLLDIGRPQEAIEQLMQATKLNPAYLEAQYNLGNALVQAGRPSEAIGHYQLALRIASDRPDVFNNLGIALVQTGRPKEAIERYKQALDLKPDNIEALNNLGSALILAGRPEEALEHCRQALRLNPEHTEAHYNLANALIQTGRPEGAVEHYEQVLRSKPNFPDAHGNLGVALVRTGRPEEAIDHYLQALALKPDFTAVAFNLALAYDKINQSPKAVQAAQKALELARSQGLTMKAKQIEDWLNSHDK